jgi:3-hydroxy-9,10-secoandrosta-1,3,5(10)-triene-9,17-dione monooxygenase reductase component
MSRRAANGSAADPSHFRSVFGHVPTAVTIVAGLDPSGSPVGLTIGSFASVSLAPPLAGFFVGASSTSWSRMSGRGSFCASVLTVDQDDLCWRFARDPEPGSDSRFEGVAWTASPGGLPIVDGACAWIECDVESVAPAGDHQFVLGRVTALESMPGAPGAMVFYRGRTGGASFSG